MKTRAIVPTVMLVGTLFLTACAAVNDKALRLFSSQAKAFAIVNGQLLTGAFDLLPDRTGTVTLASSGDVMLRCAGQFRYTGTLSGTLNVRCSDGSIHDLQISALGEISGYGYSQNVNSVASLAYGMAATDAMAVLRPPAGKSLILKADGEGMELQ